MLKLQTKIKGIKMKYLLMALMLTGCNESDFVEHEDAATDTYIVAGQSNAVLCNWGYFEDKTGSKTIMLAEGGKTIGYLFNNFKNKKHILDNVDVKAILFVHGESDAMNGNEVYSEKVEAYRELVGGYPLLVSNVGYFGYHKTVNYPDSIFNNITSQVNDEIASNKNWFLAFDDAKYFRDWGMLKEDGVHFTEDGCMMMMDAMAESIYRDLN